MKTRSLMAAVLIGLGSTLDSLAATLTWTGAAGSDFYNRTNWSPQAVPASGDTLNVTGGPVNISPPFVCSGQINWTAGNLYGAFTVATNGVLAVSGTSTLYLYGTVTNWGTVTVGRNFNFNYQQCGLLNQPGAVVDVQGDYALQGGSAALIVNAGTFQKSAGSGTATVSLPFVNTGLVTAQSGGLSMNSGGTLTGTWAAAPGASVRFYDGSFTLTPDMVFSGGGFIGVNGGTPTFAGTLTRTLPWVAGSLYGAFTIATNGVLAVGGTGTVYLYGTVTNWGAVTVGSNLRFYYPQSGLLNQPGALVDVQGDYLLSPSGTQGLGFVNAGTFQKSAGSGTATVSMPFVNTGLVTAQSGKLSLNSGGTLTGIWAAVPGASVLFYDGNFTLIPDMVFSGGGFVGVNGGSPTFAGTLTRILPWVAGNLYGAFTVATNGVLAIGGTSSQLLYGTVTNLGTVTVGNDFTFGGAQSGLVNQPGAVVDMQGDYGMSPSGTQGLGFVNAGTFLKSAGSGTATVSMPFVNTGLVTVQSGKLSLKSGGTLTGTWAAVPGASVLFYGGNFTLTPDMVFSGGGFIGVNGGSPTFAGTLTRTLPWVWGSLYGAFTVATNGVLAIGGTSTKHLYGTVTNWGTVTVGDDFSFLYAQSGLLNQPGAVVDVQGDYGLSPSGTQGLGFVNAGTFQKSAGSGTATVSMPFVNTGLVTVQSGKLSLKSGGTLTGTWAAVPGASVLFYDGNFTLTPDMVFSGGGFIGVNGGSPTFAGTLTRTLPWVWGSLYGAFTVATNGVLAIGGTSTKHLYGTVTNWGTVTVGDDFSFLYAQSGLLNQPGAVVDVQGDYGLSPSGTQGLGFVNAGTFQKSAGSGTCTPNVHLLNTGTVEAKSGVISLGTAFVNSGGTLAVRLNSPTNWGKVAFANPVALSGPFAVSVLLGYTPAVGSRFAVVTYPSATGSFSTYCGLDLGGGLKLVPEYGSSGFNLTVGMYPSPDAPPLSVYRLPDSALVWWPIGYTNFTLQAATNLLAPTWERVPLTGPNQALVPADQPAEFFRLVR